MDEFLLRALIGGIGVAIISGPLGCLVVWQRMAYFGATLSHAALLGIALGFFLEINLTLSILLICIGISIPLVAMDKVKQLNSDTMLGILAHSTLALGILVLAMMPTLRVDLMGYLFGDILTIGWSDITLIYLSGIAVFTVLAFIWRPLLALIVQRDLALVDGVNEQRIKLLFLILLSIAVAITMQVAGILLIVSLLIIPAAAARRRSTSPEQMALYSGLIGVLSIAAGLWMSLQFDTPAGPSIVVVASLIFLLSNLFPKTA